MRTLGMVFVVLAGMALSQLSWFPAPNTSDFGLYVLVVFNFVLGALLISRSSLREK